MRRLTTITSARRSHSRSAWPPADPTTRPTGISLPAATDVMPTVPPETTAAPSSAADDPCALVEDSELATLFAAAGAPEPESNVLGEGFGECIWEGDNAYLSVAIVPEDELPVGLRGPAERERPGRVGRARRRPRSPSRASSESGRAEGGGTSVGFSKDDTGVIVAARTGDRGQPGRRPGARHQGGRVHRRPALAFGHEHRVAGHARRRLRASAAVGDRLHRTPMFSSATLSREIGARVFLKAELFQRTGSFKPRGAAREARLAEPGGAEPRRVTVSAGNAAAGGRVRLARSRGSTRSSCMWQGASALKVAAVRGYGATVDQEAADPTEAFERLAEVAERDRAHVRPSVRRRHRRSRARARSGSRSSRTAPGRGRRRRARSAAAGSSRASTAA